MSNYTKSTNFAAKDSLPSGNAAKLVKGTEIDAEFSAIETAVGTKADTASPTFTGTPAAPTAAVATDSTQIATTAFVKDVMETYGINAMTVQNASGTSVDFTSIPSWAKRVTITYESISTNGTAQPLIQLGDSGGVEATGYVTHVSPAGGVGTAVGSGFTLVSSTTATNVHNGVLVLELHSASNNMWVGQGMCNHTGSTDAMYFTVGRKSLSGTLDRVRFTTNGGTATFDGGSISVHYE